MSYRCKVCNEHKRTHDDICKCGTKGDNDPKPYDEEAGQAAWAWLLEKIDRTNAL